jgi:hypothetical protein
MGVSKEINYIMNSVKDVLRRIMAVQLHYKPDSFPTFSATILLNYCREVKPEEIAIVTETKVNCVIDETYRKFSVQEEWPQ